MRKKNAVMFSYKLYLLLSKLVCLWGGGGGTKNDRDSHWQNVFLREREQNPRHPHQNLADFPHLQNSIIKNFH